MQNYWLATYVPPRIWTPKEDALLTKMSDGNLAELLGTSRNEIMLRRQRMFRSKCLRKNTAIEGEEIEPRARPKSDPEPKPKPKVNKLRPKPKPKTVKVPKEPRRRFKIHLSTVYVIKGAGIYKIGRTTNLKSRFSALQNSSPVGLKMILHLECLDNEGLEEALHKLFASKNSHGEWFALTELDLDFLMRLKKVIEVKDFKYKGPNWKIYIPEAFSRFSIAHKK